MSIEDLEFPVATNKEQLLAAIDHLRSAVVGGNAAATVGEMLWRVISKVIATYGQASIAWLAVWVTRKDRASQGLCQYYDGEAACESQQEVSGLCRSHAKTLGLL